MHPRPCGSDRPSAARAPAGWRRRDPASVAHGRRARGRRGRARRRASAVAAARGPDRGRPGTDALGAGYAADELGRAVVRRGRGAHRRLRARELRRAGRDAPRAVGRPRHRNGPRLGARGARSLRDRYPRPDRRHGRAARDRDPAGRGCVELPRRRSRRRSRGRASTSAITAPTWIASCSAAGSSRTTCSRPS